METFPEIAPYLTHPLVLVGFVLMLFFSIHRTLIKSGLIPPLSKKDGTSVLQQLLRYGFWVALAIIIAGVVVQTVQLWQQTKNAELGRPVVDVNGDNNRVVINNAQIPSQLLDTLRQQGVTQGALNSFFATLQLEQVPPDKLSQALQSIAERHLALKQQIAQLQQRDSEHSALLAQAEASLNEGEYGRAESLIQAYDVAEAKAEAETLEKLSRQRLNRAAAKALLGEAALAQFQHQKAANYFEQAANLVPEDQVKQKVTYQLQRADTLYDLGLYKGNNAAFEKAIEIYRNALNYYSREHSPMQWAGVQNNLGLALWTLGEREPGRGRLEEAAIAFRQALEVRSRDRAQLDWATIHNNLGNVLVALSDRGDHAKWLEQAVSSYRLALLAFTRQSAPADWAMTQHNLGTALMKWGEREPGSEKLLQAVSAFRLALEERPRSQQPLEWAMTQNNLGNALSTLGEREAGTENLEQAVAAYQLALKERTRLRVPVDWAMTQSNLGIALANLGAAAQNHNTQRQHYQQAIIALQGAKTVLVNEVGLKQYERFFDSNIRWINSAIQKIPAEDQSLAQSHYPE